MIINTLELTNDEKLYLLTGVAVLQAMESLVGFQFQILNKDGSARYTMGTTNLLIPEILTKKFQEALLQETKGRIMIMENTTVIQAYDCIEAKADTLLKAIIKFLVQNWFRKENDNYVFSFKFRRKIKEILAES